MPKKRRQAHIPQQSSRRRKAAPKRNFGQPPPEAPENEHRIDLEGNPIFANELAVPEATGVPALGGSGPVETRPHWIGPTTSRRQGRRRQELRDAVSSPVRLAPGQLPTYDRAFLVSELQRIGVISGVLLLTILVLAFAMR